MRLIEKCSCGASIEIIWDESSYYHKGEDKRATKELGVWRRAHANCGVSAPAKERDVEGNLASLDVPSVAPGDEGGGASLPSSPSPAKKP